MPPKQAAAAVDVDDEAAAVNPDSLTDDEMEGLSDEERAALDYDEPGDDADDKPKDEEDAGDGEEQEVETAEDDKEAGKQEPEPAAAAKEEQPAGDEGQDKSEEAGTATQQDDVAELSRAYQESMGALDEEYAGLGKKVEDGDMTFAQYHERVKEINDAKMATRSAYEDDLNWQRAQSTFFKDEANAAFLDPMRQTFLQATLDKMYKDGELNGVDYGSAILKAAERVKGALNIGAESASQPPKVQAKPKKAQPKIPQTLGDVPPADDNMIEPDKFRHLEGLEGDDLEAALAKMPTSEVDAWLESAG
jgi:hypothetical protein